MRAGPTSVVRGAVTLYILVAFLVFHLVLAIPASGFSDGSVHFGTVQNTLLHTVTPLFAVLDWLLIRSDRSPWRWAATAWLGYPLAYPPVLLLRGAVGHEYPHPFLDLACLRHGGA